VTSLSVRPVTLLSVIYSQKSHNIVIWKIQREGRSVFNRVSRITVHWKLLPLSILFTELCSVRKA
jgi:hypothetical protein